MFRELLSSRLIQVGLAFFVLVVGGSLLYRWHVQRTVESGRERHAQLLQTQKKQNETRPAPSVNVPTEMPGFVDTPEENTDAPIAEDTEALENNTETRDIADAFLPEDVVAEEAPEEEGAVSPYGFGPYPEVPTDYPGGTPIWERDLDALGFSEAQKRDSELLSRVLIKLWVEQGIGSYLGGSFSHDTGIVYPFFENTIYVKRTVLKDPDGTEKGVSARIISPGTMFITGEETERFRLTGETPPGVRVLQIDTDGIDPYEFLNLQR